MIYHPSYPGGCRFGVRSIADVRSRVDTLPGTATGAATGLTKVGTLVESQVVSTDFMLKVQEQHDKRLNTKFPGSFSNV